MRRTLLAIALALASSCYDPKSPNLPPCQPGAAWPDPCDSPFPTDAGAE